MTDSPEKLQALSELLARHRLASYLGSGYGGDRDIYKSLGYPTELTFQDYLAQYARQDIARAVIKRPVQTTWKGGVRIFEAEDDEDTDLEKVWDEMFKRLGLHSKLARLDRMTGLGEYGVLLLGFNDVDVKEKFREEPSGRNLELLYVKPFGQGSVEIKDFEKDPNNERYGLPLLYQITTRQPGGGGEQQLHVHYERVIHVVNELLESEVESEPRLQGVFNRLKDLEKLVGGSAEMFWRGARPGYTGKADEGYEFTPTSKTELETEIKEYEHDLRRFLLTSGVNVQSLAPQVSDPTSHIEAQLKMISAETGIPMRILVGSERGELASSQDQNAWYDQITARREEYAEPIILEPFAERCIKYGVLPKPKSKLDGYSWQWVELYSQSTQDKVNVGKSRAEALATYSSAMGAEEIVPHEAFFQFFLGLEQEEIEQIQAQRAEAAKEEEDEIAEAEREAERLAKEQGIDPDQMPQQPGQQQPGQQQPVGANLATLFERSRDELGRFAPEGGGSSFDTDKGWVGPDGEPLSETDQKRMAEHNVPKAWSDVRLNDDPTAPRQVIGKDSKGRVQSRYSKEHQRAAEVEKYARVKQLNENIDTIRDGAKSEMADETLTARDRDSAACVALITETGMRPGSLKDTGAEHQAYGATTLEGRHIESIDGDTVTVKYVGGKAGGQERVTSFQDRDLAEYISSKDVGPNDRLFDVSNDSVRDAMGRNGGDGFKVKDIRTWKGTTTAASKVSEMTAPKNKKEFAKSVREVADTVAAQLGNTRAVALSSYINPEVFHEWEAAIDG